MGEGYTKIGFCHLSWWCELATVQGLKTLTFRRFKISLRWILFVLFSDSILFFFRQDCGYPGISASQCQSRGCCWDSSVSNFPWCFHGPTRPTPFPTAPPPPTTRPPSQWDCTFETGFCNWNNSKEDDFNWNRQSGSSPSIGTGPTSDHTTGSLKGGLEFIW